MSTFRREEIEQIFIKLRDDFESNVHELEKIDTLPIIKKNREIRARQLALAVLRPMVEALEFHVNAFSEETAEALQKRQRDGEYSEFPQ